MDPWLQEIVRVLARAGADLEVSTDDGDTPLKVAASWGYTGTVQVFLLSSCQDYQQMIRLISASHRTRSGPRPSKRAIWGHGNDDGHLLWKQRLYRCIALSWRGPQPEGFWGQHSSGLVNVAQLRGHQSDTERARGSGVQAVNKYFQQFYQE